MFKDILKMRRSFTVWSCDVDDDYVDYNFEFIPIENVVIPESFNLGDTYQISMTYFKPTSCYAFHDFYYASEGNERTVAVINVVFESSNCVALEDEPVEVFFNFIAKYNQTYVFKFWQGEDENGEDIFLTYEVPVVE